MFSNIIKSTRDLGRSTANRSAALATFAHDTISGFITTTHHALMVLGIGAIAALALMFVKPEITDHLKALSPFTTSTIHEPDVSNSEFASLMDTPSKPFTPAAQTTGPLREDIVVSGMENKYENATQEQALVANWISKRYHVAHNATQMLVSASYKTADELQLDPLLILAVAAIESGFNPFAESAMGAQGLMQVMSKIHHDKFRRLGGEQAALNPVANIKVGALILKDYVARGGSVEAGLKMYVGAGAMASDSGYGSRVLAEYHRLKEVAAGKNVPAGVTTTASKTPQKAIESTGEQKKPPVGDDQSA